MCTFRYIVGITAMIISALDSAASSCVNPGCRLGFEFCEPVKGVCRQCDDFKEFCFVDNRHISNCSSYCKARISEFSELYDTNKFVDTTENNLLIAVIVLAIFLVFAVIGFFVLLYLYLKSRPVVLPSEASTDSGGTVYSSLTTVSETEKHSEDLGPEAGLLDKDHLVKQIGTTNDRNDNPKLTVSGQTIDSELNSYETSCKSMDKE